MFCLSGSSLAEELITNLLSTDRRCVGADCPLAARLFQFTKSNRLRAKFNEPTCRDRLSHSQNCRMGPGRARRTAPRKRSRYVTWPIKLRPQPPRPEISHPAGRGDIVSFPHPRGAPLSRHSFTFAEKIGDCVFVCRRIPMSACTTTRTAPPARIAAQFLFDGFLPTGSVWSSPVQTAHRDQAFRS